VSACVHAWSTMSYEDAEYPGGYVLAVGCVFCGRRATLRDWLGAS